MKRWEQVGLKITDFRKVVCVDAPPFTIRAAYDYQWSKEQYKSVLKADRRFQDSGVYLIFSANEELIYVGVAMYTFEKRIWRHPNLDELGACFIDTISFDDPYKPLAIALEWFLITRLKPKGNKVAVGYDVPVDAL